MVLAVSREMSAGLPDTPTLLPRQFVESMDTGDRLRLYTLRHGVRSRQPAVVRRGQYLSAYAAFAIRLLTESYG